jgi:hypothetical protein
MPPEASVAAAPAAPAAPVADPNAPPVPGQNGATPEDKKPPVDAAASNPFEFELDVKGQKQKLKFAGKDQLQAVLQKALYADQVIKDATQAKKGAEFFMQKLKTPEGIREILSDPAIGQDYKKIALAWVNEMIEDEKLTPEQRKIRDLENENKTFKEQEAKAKADAAAREAAEKQKKQAIELRGQIVGAMKKYPDIPQTQATMDAVIQNMRAGFRRFGKHLSADQAMAVYSAQYWNSFMSTFDKMTDEQIASRFGEKTGQKIIDRIQKLKLQELRGKTDPSKKPSGAPAGNGKPKKNLTEKEFDKHFNSLAGLGGL